MKRCEWARIAAYTHPIATKGMVNESNFIKLVKSHGGIHGLYKWATNNTKKRSVRKPGGGKGMPGAEADEMFKDNFEKLKANQSGESTERQLVAVVFDITHSKTYPNLATMKARFSPRDIKEVLLIQKIDEAVLELMEEGGEADA